jgi:Nif-specific regulatory protein
VRELENTVERIVLMGSEHGISADEMLLLLPAFNQKLMCQRRIMSEEE